MTDRLPHGLEVLRELGPDDSALLELARAAAANSYAPYSNYPTGTGLRTARGATFQGCNMENASFFSICGERTAIAAARVAEGEALTITDMVVWTQAATGPPCGACRQYITEFAPDARVIFPYEGAFAVMRGRDLLPISFQLAPPTH